MVKSVHVTIEHYKCQIESTIVCRHNGTRNKAVGPYLLFLQSVLMTLLDIQENCVSVSDLKEVISHLNHMGKYSKQC